TCTLSLHDALPIYECDEETVPAVLGSLHVAPSPATRVGGLDGELDEPEPRDLAPGPSLDVLQAGHRRDRVVVCVVVPLRHVAGPLGERKTPELERQGEVVPITHVKERQLP